MNRRSGITGYVPRDVETALPFSAENFRPDPKRVSAVALLHLFDRRWGACRREFLRCRKDSSPQSVHELRVQSRRLISVLGLIEKALPAAHTERVRRAAKACQRSLTKLRDTQVELQLARRWEGRLPEIRPLLRHLKRRERKLTRKARRDLKRTELNGLDRAAASLRKDIEEIARSRQPRSITKARFLKIIDPAFTVAIRLLGRVKTNDPASIHRVRIAFRKFRYLAEGATGILGVVDLDWLQAMRALQRRMGRIQDTEILLQRIVRFAAHHPREREAMSRLRRVVLGLQTRLIRQFTQAAGELEQLWPPPRRPRRPVTSTQN